MFSDLKEKTQKRLTNFDNENRLANFVISMFATAETETNPFNKKWEQNGFESLLLIDGKCAIWFDELENDYVFSTVNFVGNIDFQGIGKDANCTTKNGHNKVFSNWRENDDVVIIFNNETHTPDFNIERYADLQTETWLSIKMAVLGTRYNKMIGVKDEKTRLQVETAIDNNKDGKPIIAVSNNTSIFEDEEGKITSIKLTDFNESDKMQYLSTLSTWIERDFINKYGMASQGGDKVAQQNEAEIKNGAFSSWVEITNRLKERQKGFKQVKEKFNLDIPYSLSNVWQKEYDRLFVNVSRETEQEEPKTETEQEEGVENDN